jgi:hypothetical protein
MNEERSASQVSWSARINPRERCDTSDCSAWANPARSEIWTQRGLIVRQEETQHIIRLSATNAIQILDNHRAALPPSPSCQFPNLPISQSI